MGRLWVIAACLAGCIRPNLVECDDGRVCPDGTVCDTVHTSCVTPAQTTVCSGIADGERCDAAGLAGLCDQGVCVPGCGDGVHSAGEECDDGNARDHDGCSAACLTESPRWTLWHSKWAGRTQAAAALFSASPVQGIVLFSGLDEAGVHADQWHIRSADDWQLRSLAGPPARSQFAMAYDTARKVLVVFGGSDGMGAPLGDTWEFDGTTWTERTSSAAPSARVHAKMVYDSKRSRMVLFGGYAGGTWEYDGTTWQLITNAGPAPRAFHMLAYDDAREVVVLHGGLTATAAAVSDTWEYNGTWTLVNAQPPPARLGAAMAYSPSRGKVVMFGGIILLGDTYLGNDTWEFDGNSWTTPYVGPIAPPARYFATLSAGTDGELRLIGGADQNGKPRPDVWRQAANGQWSEDTPKLTPQAREISLAYDDARGEAIFYGGNTITARSDPWQFDGSSWRATPGPGLALHDSAVAFDSKRKVGVLFGGIDETTAVSNATLEWNGTQWAQVFPPTKPSARYGSTMAFDADRGVMVLVGGNDLIRNLDDTWEYDGTTWTQIQPTTRPFAGEYMRISYDPVHHRIVGMSPNAVTWVYENHDWRSYRTDPAPSQRVGSNLVFHPLRGTTMLLNGFGQDFVYDSRLWELAFDAADEPRWTVTDVSGVAPDSRYKSGVTYMPALNAVVEYGGSSPAGPRGDTWLLTFE